MSDKLKEIKEGTFIGCSSLESLTIPGSVEIVIQGTENLNHNAFDTFYDCESLKELVLEYGDKLDSGYMYSRLQSVGWRDWINILEYLSIDRELVYPMSPKALTELTLGGHIVKVQVEINKCEKLNKLTCYATTPPSDLSVTNAQYMNVEVKVPKGTLEAYQSADGWKNFWNISEMEDSGSGIESVVSDKAKTEIGRYNLQGRKVTADYPGMVIVKYSDGSTRKLINN